MSSVEPPEIVTLGLSKSTVTATDVADSLEFPALSDATPSATPITTVPPP